MGEQRTLVRLRDYEVGDCFWAFDETYGDWCWVEHEMVETAYTVDNPPALPRFWDEHDSDENYWWVENEFGERYAFQSIDIEEVPADELH